MLRNIIVRDIGVLKAFDTPLSPRLERFTAFFARNGRGKTTLASILRSAASNDVISLQRRRTFGSTGAEPSVILKRDDYPPIKYENGRWTGNIPPIHVFDSTYIADNLYAGETIDLQHDRRLFTLILGRAGVKLARHQNYFTALAKRTHSIFKDAEAALKVDLPSNLSLEQFLAASPDEALDSDLTKAEKELKAVLEVDKANAIPALDILNIPVIASSAELVLQSTVDGVDVEARAKLATHFKTHSLGARGEAWVKFGLEHLHEDNCPFCGQNGADQAGLISVYSTIFGEAYKAHFERVTTLVSEFDATFGNSGRETLSSFLLRNQRIYEAASAFYNLSDFALPNTMPIVAKWSEVHDLLEGAFSSKKASPLESVSLEAFLSQAEPAVAELRRLIEQYNININSCNSVVDRSRRTAPKSADDAHRKLQDLQRLKRRNDLGVKQRIAQFLAAKARDKRAKDIRGIVQQRLKDENEAAATHFHAAVNSYLDRFQTTFKISPISNSMTGNAGSVDYGLVVRGHPVSRGRGKVQNDAPTFKEALSSGDKATLALAFFLANFDREMDPENHIVVFDDPMSSHDSDRRSKTADIICKLCGTCLQVVVLSHDEHFLRDIEERCGRIPMTSYEIDHDGSSDSWSRAIKTDLDALCRNLQAKRLDRLKAFYDRMEGAPEDIVLLVRKALESHYRQSYTGYFNRSDNLRPIIDTIETAGESHPCWKNLKALKECNAETCDDHHGEDPQVTRQPLSPQETRRIVGLCLTLVNAVRQEEIVI